MRASASVSSEDGAVLGETRMQSMPKAIVMAVLENILHRPKSAWGVTLDD